MKKVKLLFVFIFLSAGCMLKAQGVSINNDGSVADGSAMLDLQSTEKGFLPPRMTTSEIASISSPAEGLTVYNTTTHKPAFYNGTGWHYYDGSVCVPYIGAYYAGGVVFYLDGAGGGLVCAVSDQSSGAPWGCFGQVISGADNPSIGGGRQNTMDICMGCAESGIAARICDNVIIGIYGDWFLPSKDELNAMYLNKAAINATAIANGGSAFADNFYWSSTEQGSSQGYTAWAQYFISDYQTEIGKTASYPVRAVRSF
jgi:hypothetical protein